MSLATKYRPHKFEDVSGQESAIMILKQQLNLHRFKNAYIFSGASGSGKTTCARIFANEINEGKGTPIEIDAASNNGVDNVRNISEIAKERSLDSEYKIIIFDEAHMLTLQSWNALLKLLEEPPKYTIFILCTTDPQKIPDTIKNRCMRFNFSRIPAHQIKSRLEYICREEQFINYLDACDYISRICKGEMRNGISLLETCADYSDDLCIDNVITAIGNYSYDTYFNLVNSIIDGNISESLNIINDIYNNGSDLNYFINSFLDFILDISKYILCGDIRVTKFPMTLQDKLKFATGIDNASQYYLYFADKLFELKKIIKTDNNIKSSIEVMITQMCRLI